jgi:hypothetical protein
MTPTLLLLWLALAVEPSPAKFTFVDAYGPESNASPRYRPLAVGENPARPLIGAPNPGPGVVFSLARIGSGRESALGVVWQSQSQVMWLDANGDGRLMPDERHAFSQKTIELSATIHVWKTAVPRTLIFKRGAGTNLYVAARGYTRGKLRLAGKDFAAALTDGDADGCFDSAGADRVWIDLNGDGVFDPVSEQFPLGTPIAVMDRLFLIQPDPSGTTVNVRERGSETGKLRPSVPLLAGATLREIEAGLVSEFGELAVLKSIEPAELPVGKYRLESLTVTAADVKDRVWTFRFRGQRQFGLAVEARKESVADLLEGLVLTTGVNEESAKPGAYIMVSPTWQTSVGVYLTECQINGTSGGADIVLADSGGNALERVSSGFL